MAHISTKDLFWHKESRSFSIEVCELPNKRIPLKRIYQDSCDEGFTLVSHHTGIEIDFYLNKTSTWTDGGVAAWYFLPVIKNGPVTKVTIFND